MGVAKVPPPLRALTGFQELFCAHPQTFRTVVDTDCRDTHPLECSVRSDELPVSMRMRMRVVMCGYACTCAREFDSASRP